MDKYDVFISYSRKDTVIADRICKALSKAGITYFIDRKGIGGGIEFPLVLADAICESSLFLFLASDNSYKSKFTNNEITFAFNEKPKHSILPYIIDGSELPRHIRFIFAGINWRNLKEHPIETVLVSDLASLLDKKEEVHSKARIITPEHAELIRNLVLQINPIDNIINGIIKIKEKYSAIIQIKTFRKITNVGTAIIGKVLYGNVNAGGKYLIGTHDHTGVITKEVLFHNISESPMYSNLVIRTIKRFSPRESDYNLYLNIFSSVSNAYKSDSQAKSGDTVGMFLSGVTPEYIKNFTHLYKL